jgi:hypothetical protein
VNEKVKKDMSIAKKGSQEINIITGQGCVLHSVNRILGKIFFFTLSFTAPSSKKDNKYAQICIP